LGGKQAASRQQAAKAARQSYANANIPRHIIISIPLANSFERVFFMKEVSCHKLESSPAG